MAGKGKNAGVGGEGVLVIKQVTPEEAENIINTRAPLGLFYLIEDGVYVGIDNSTGDAWTEEFATKKDCLTWLRGA